MASQHVFLVQHEAFGLTSLKKRKTEKLGAGGEARSGLVAKIVDFVHPRTDRMGPDDLLIRINETSVLAWLTAKVERATKRFLDLANDTDSEGGVPGGAGGGSSGGGGGGGTNFARSFEAIAAPGGAVTGEVEAECKRQALEAVCEYLGKEWGGKLAEKFSSERAVLFGGKSSVPQKRKAVWEESVEADRNLELSHGSGGGLKTKAEVAAAAKAKQPLTHAQRSLAKVNKKGMKSIASFFGK